jgi:hypothetical protein
MSLVARKPTLKDWGISALVLLLCAVGLNWCAGKIADLPEADRVCRPVVSVGACDRDGWCGVVLEGGDYIIARYPSVGAPICRFESVEEQ